MKHEKIGIFERLGLAKAALSGNKSSILNNVTRSIYNLMPTYGEPPKNSDTNWIKTYNLNPRMNPVHQISSDVATAEYGIYSKKNKDSRLESHPIYDLLNNPCTDMAISYYALLYITQVYLLLPTGEAFWLKERNRLGIPSQLWPIPPNWVSEIPSKVNPNFRIQPLGNMDATPIPVPMQDIVYFKKVDVSNPYLRGIGRVEAIGDEIETDEYMAKFQKKFFYNNAIPAMVGQMPGADEAVISRTEEAWRQKYGGYNNSHKVAWLGWDAKIQILKETTKEMDFVESRKYLRDTANQHFCIPPEIFGILENSNRSTIDAAYYLYSKNVLRKELKFISDTINRQLLPDYREDVYLKFDNIVPQDEAFDLKRVNDGILKGSVTIDEWRIANKMEELPNGKGKILFIPNNVTPIDLNGKSIPEEINSNKNPTSSQGIGPQNINQEEDIINPQEEILSSKKKSKSLTDEQRKGIWEVFDKTAIKNEASFIESMQIFFTGQENRVIKSISKNYNRKSDNPENPDNIDNLLDWKEEDLLLFAILKKEWIKGLKSGYEIANSTYSFGISFDLLNPKFLDWVNTQGFSQVKDINKTTQDALQKTLSEGITNGEGIPKLKKRVTETFDIAKGYRSELIARTETHNTVGTGTFETYKTAGVEKKEWLATSDNRTRDSHAHLNREVVNFDKSFSNGLMFPGDASGPPSEVINCRCTILPVIE